MVREYIDGSGGFKGVTKIEDAWDRTVYQVVANQSLNDVYIIESVNRPGERYTVNRSSLRPCVDGNGSSTGTPLGRHRRRRLLCAPGTRQEKAPDESPEESADDAPLLLRYELPSVPPRDDLSAPSPPSIISSETSEENFWHRERN